MLPPVLHCAVCIIFLRVRHSHPANLNSPAILRRKALGRVKVKTCVQLPELSIYLSRPEVLLQKNCHTLIYIVISQSVCFHSLRRDAEHCPSIHLIKIRALPHKTEGFFCLQTSPVFPVQTILRLEDKDNAFILRRSGSLHHIIPSILLPDLRVPHMTGQVFRIILICHQKLLAVKMKSICACRADCIGLPACMDVIVIACLLYISRIIQDHLSILHKSGTGIHTMTVKRLIRSKGRSFKAPVKQIAAGAVSPEFQSAFYIKG